MTKHHFGPWYAPALVGALTNNKVHLHTVTCFCKSQRGIHALKVFLFYVLCITMVLRLQSKCCNISWFGELSWIVRTHLLIRHSENWSKVFLCLLPTSALRSVLGLAVPWPLLPILGPYPIVYFCLVSWLSEAMHTRGPGGRIQCRAVHCQIQCRPIYPAQRELVTTCNRQ